MTFQKATKDDQSAELGNRLVRGVSQEEYRAGAAVSASTLKDFGRSAAYARYNLLNPTPATPAMEWGTAIHTAVLEPDELSKRYALDPTHPEGRYPKGWRNTKVYREVRAEIEAEGKSVLTVDQYEELGLVGSSVHNHRIGDMLGNVTDGTELSGFALDEEFGVWRKIRPDLLAKDARTVVELKSSADVSPSGFSRACARFGYHISAAYYMDTLEIISPGDYLHYVFLVVANTAPYEVAAYTLDWDSLAQGRTEYRKYLEAYSECVRSGNWPGPNDEIEEIRLPAYALTNMGEF